MTTWHQPLKRQRDGRWDFTASNTSGSSCYPEGYCRGWTEYTDEEKRAMDARLGEGFSERLIAERDRHLAHKAKFHTDGHATAEEASACYRDYVFDCEREERVSPDTQKPCAECGAWTPNVVFFGRMSSRALHLCDAHKDEATMRKHYDAGRRGGQPQPNPIENGEVPNRIDGLLWCLRLAVSQEEIDALLKRSTELMERGTDEQRRAVRDVADNRAAELRGLAQGSS